jgi:hypothetical protein
MLITLPTQNVFQLQASIFLTKNKFTQKVALKRKEGYDEEETASKQGQPDGIVMEVDDNNNSSNPNIAHKPPL